MTHKAITIHVITTDAGNAYWELRTTSGELLTDSAVDGLYGVFASEAAASENAAQIAVAVLASKHYAGRLG